MKVRVAYTTTVDDFFRRAVNLYYGRPGLASRAQVRDWLRQNGDNPATSEDLIWQLQTAIERGEEREL